MIEIKNLNKYFNKNKRNEIHVINNTSVSLEDNGLVALLGQSGCGKTTLLNVIGGLDKVKNGNIYVNGEKMTSKLTYKKDKIRNLNIGYIFQDYKLIENLTVAENVSIVLKMIGMKDKKEIKERVEFVLEKVGMLRYKKRPVSMLSGGERQRVGIARAIVKDPDIILADEPTGNLDSKNSLEIMKIIKAISKEKLVILVTHEKELAKFYASRVIELEDGSIVADYENDHSNELDYEIDNVIYLKDFKNIKKDKNVNIYSDSKDDVKLDIIVKNGNVYIRSNNELEAQVITEESTIDVIDDHYKKVAKEDIDKYNFNYNKINKKKYVSITNIFKSIFNGFKSIFKFPILKKILLLGFLLSGAFIMYSISSISASYNIEDEKFVTINKNYLLINTKKYSIEDFNKYKDNDFVNYILPSDSTISLNMYNKEYYQFKDVILAIGGSLSDISMINEDDLIYGNMPENNNEIVVDKFVINKLLKEDQSKMMGYNNLDDFIGQNLEIKYLLNYKIVGISDTNSPSIYTSNTEFDKLLYYAHNNDNPSRTLDGMLINYNEITYTLKEGRLPTNDYEVIVNINNKDTFKLNKEMNKVVNDKKLVVVGYYYSPYDLEAYLVNSNTIKYDLIRNRDNIVVYVNDKEKAIETYRSYNLNVKDSYEHSKEVYKKTKSSQVKSTLIVAFIILGISLIEIFLMIRASFLSRVKEIGILRAIGIKKKDIYKMFAGEIIAITTLAGLPGVLIMSYILKVLSGITYISDYIMINIPLVLLAVVFLYLFNLVIGLLPVFNTVKKTPASILARYDVD